MYCWRILQVLGDWNKYHILALRYIFSVFGYQHCALFIRPGKGRGQYAKARKTAKLLLIKSLENN
jgi:hypothetical protein